MNNVITISIKPKFIDRILAGTKIFEFRKTLPKKVDFALLYCAAPISRIVAIAHVTAVHRGSVEEIFTLAGDKGGCSKHFYDSYFKDKKEACALEFELAKKLKNPVDIEGRPPQSWQYCTDNLAWRLFAGAEFGGKNE